MLEHNNQTQGVKAQVTAQPIQQKQSNERGAFEFEDNRSKSVAQLQLQEIADNSPQVQQLMQFQKIADQSHQNSASLMPPPFRLDTTPPIQRKENNTGLPDNLKSGIENLSGYSMDDVKVHYNSDKPAQLNAHAYAQGTNIHLGAGQEKHLAHEAWHVVQQKQGRVKPTKQMKGKVAVNDDKGLEKEADLMGAKALQMKEKEEAEPIEKATYYPPFVCTEAGDGVREHRSPWAVGKRYGCNSDNIELSIHPYTGEQIYVLPPKEGYSIEVNDKIYYHRSIWAILRYYYNASKGLYGEKAKDITLNGQTVKPILTKIKTGDFLVLKNPGKEPLTDFKPNTSKEDIPEKITTNHGTVRFPVGLLNGKRVGDFYDIYNVQTLLLKGGYLDNEKDIDGNIGPKTVNAIKDFLDSDSITDAYISPNDGSLDRLIGSAKKEVNKNSSIPNKTKVETVELKDLSHKRLERIFKMAMINFNDNNTSNANLEIKIRIGVLGSLLFGAIDAGGGGQLEGTLSMSVDDDRKFRMNAEWGLGVYGEANALWESIKYDYSKIWNWGTQHIYHNIEHGAAVTYQRIMGKVYEAGIFLEKKANSSDLSDLYKGKKKERAKSLAIAKTPFIENNYSKIKINQHGEIFDGLVGGDYDKGSITSNFKQGTKSMQGTINYLQASISVERNGRKFQGTFTQNEISDDYNTDNDGDYRNISFSFNVSKEVLELWRDKYIDKLADQVLREMGYSPIKRIYPKKLLGSISELLGDSLFQYSKNLSSSKNRGTDIGANVEINLILNSNKDKWLVQYTRLSVSHNSSFEFTKKRPIATAGVGTLYGKIHFESALSNQVGIVEILGRNTLSYISTVYNGIKDRSDITDDVGDWQSYKSKHIPAIKSMIRKIGNGNTLDQVLQDEKYKSYVDRCKKYVNEGEGSMSTLLQDFDKEILDKLYEERKNKIKANWN